MKRRIHLKAMSWQFLLVALIVSVTGYVGVLFLTSDQVESPLPLSSSHTTATNASEAAHPDEGLHSAPLWQVYKDPKTGQFRRPPAGALPGLTNSFGSCIEGVGVVSPVTAGSASRFSPGNAPAGGRRN